MKKLLLLILLLFVGLSGCQTTSSRLALVFNFEDPVDTVQKADVILILKVISNCKNIKVDGFDTYYYDVQVVEYLKYDPQTTITKWIKETDTPNASTAYYFSLANPKNHYYFIAGVINLSLENSFSSVGYNGIPLPNNYNPQISMNNQDENIKSIYSSYNEAYNSLIS
ncbi:MAG: hypothetical protein LBV55_03735 [Acholeplasmatales bacterium]|jgi:hypothetical protein|nr:hypothetical protein [Acholeplasmatales bacterium]